MGRWLGRGITKEKIGIEIDEHGAMIAICHILVGGVLDSFNAGRDAL
jgi:hypothetical protein